MIGASKILTVSYGTFSCTLEGFDEPFNTMKAIAEYFRDLAADDRYFGAEPPTPDATMLHRIAEREVQRRVEAKIQDNGVILRAGSGTQPPAPPPAPRPAPVPTATAAPAGLLAEESVAAKLQRIRAAVSRAAAAAPAVEDAVFVEDQHAEPAPAPAAPTPAPMPAPATARAPEQAPEAAPEAPPQPEAPSLPAAPVAVAPVATDPVAAEARSDEADAPAFADQAEAATAVSEPVEVAQPVLPEPAAIAADAESIAAEPDLGNLLARISAATADDSAAVHDAPPVAATDAPDESLPDFAALIAEATPHPAEEPSAAPATLMSDVPDGEAVTAEIELPVEAEAVAPATEPEAEAEAEAEAEQYAEADPVAVAEPEVEAEPRVEGEAAERPVEVAEAAASEHAETAEAEPDAHDAAEAEANAEASPAAEKLRRARARVIKVRRPDAATETAAIAMRAPLDEAEAILRDGRTILETSKGDEDVSRLLRQANTEMDVPENRRRISTLAHLKAAVAATVAELRAPNTASETGEPSRLDRYRADLARVVRPRRPASGTSAVERPAPLVLVSEQRIDRPADTALSRIMPRRVTAGNLALEDAADEPDADPEGDAENIFASSKNFIEFAERLGASELPDLLEAAAAYTSCIEGRPHFSRPHLMRHVTAVTEDSDIVREDSMRSFGQLLRQGKIEKVKRGQFAITDSSYYLAEARRMTR